MVRLSFRRLRPPRRALLVLLGALGASACSDLLTPERVPSKLVFSDTAFVITAGETAEPGWQVLDQHGRPYARVPRWVVPVLESSDERRFALRDGRIAALEPGEARLTMRAAGLSAAVPVRVNPERVRMVVGGAYLTQSIQRLDGSVPLVRGRDAFLRVFLTADQINFFRPEVRVHLYHGGALQRTLSLQPAGISIPTAVRQEELKTSWNVLLPGALIQPGLAIRVEADPGGAVPLTADSRASFPASGALSLEVREVPEFRARLIPIKQASNGLTGVVNAGNLAQFTDQLLRMFPIERHDVDLRSTYTTSYEARGDQWVDILKEISLLRIAEGSDRYYYGVVRRVDGPAGIGWVGWPAAIGYDLLPDASYTYAHELGHNFGRWHAPCGRGLAPESIDKSYPHRGGRIGAYGLDLTDQTVVDAGTADLMGYCHPRWISDYTYRAVLDYRQAEAEQAAAQRGAGREPALLVWGKVGPEGLELQPAFQVTTRAHLPERAGPYVVEGRSAAGARLFSLSFAGHEVADLPGGARHFAFAIPLRSFDAEQLTELRVRGLGREAVRSAGAPTRTPSERTAAPRDLSLRRLDQGTLDLRWEAASHPLVVVRDADTGEILSLARGGVARLETAARPLELVFSDGVRSTTRRVRFREEGR